MFAVPCDFVSTGDGNVRVAFVSIVPNIEKLGCVLSEEVRKKVTSSWGWITRDVLGCVIGMHSSTCVCVCTCVYVCVHVYMCVSVYQVHLHRRFC
jgi:hypothetical protein